MTAWMNWQATVRTISGHGGPCQRAKSRINAGHTLDDGQRMVLADLLGVCEQTYEELPAELKSIYLQVVEKLR